MSSPDIMFVIGSLQIGGSEQHLFMVATALARRGFCIAVCSLSGDGPLRESFEREGVTVLIPPVNRGRKMNLIVRFSKLLIAVVYLWAAYIWRRPKIAHFFLPHAYLAGAPLALLANIRIRVMSRRSLNTYQRPHPVLRRLELLLHKTMSAVLGNSLSVIADLRSEGVPADRLGLIYNGIDLARFGGNQTKEHLRQNLNIDPDMLVLTIVANLIPYKGHRDLLNALAIAARNLGTNWRLLIVGRDDGIGGELADLAKSLGIGGHIMFLGSRTDVPDILRASDIGLLCSHEEGFSNAVLEGMACGLPMIVTRVGGNPEAVVDGATGLVVAPHDPAGLAAAICQLAGAPQTRQQFGFAGRRRVVENFSLDSCVDRYEALYEGLLGRRRLQDVLYVPRSDAVEERR